MLLPVGLDQPSGQGPDPNWHFLPGVIQLVHHQGLLAVIGIIRQKRPVKVPDDRERFRYRHACRIMVHNFIN